jgi:hypothetical protein
MEKSAFDDRNTGFFFSGILRLVAQSTIHRPKAAILAPVVIKLRNDAGTLVHATLLSICFASVASQHSRATPFGASDEGYKNAD